MNSTQAKQVADQARAWLATQSWAKAFAQIGSSVYVDEPADVDFAVLVKDGIAAINLAYDLVDQEHWQMCGDYDSKDGLWCAVRLGDVNLMLANDETFYNSYVVAMKVSQGLRLQDKRDRIIVCQIIRDGVDPEDARLFAGYAP